jgi:hypothetical protein
MILIIITFYIHRTLSETRAAYSSSTIMIVDIGDNHIPDCTDHHVTWGVGSRSGTFLALRTIHCSLMSFTQTSASISSTNIDNKDTMSYTPLPPLPPTQEEVLNINNSHSCINEKSSTVTNKNEKINDSILHDSNNIISCLDYCERMDNNVLILNTEVL